MPYLTIRHTAELSDDTRDALIYELTALTARVLRKQDALTAVSIENIPRNHWAVGGRSLAEQGQHTAYLDIKVTAGTNTVDEKAAFVAQAHALLTRALGPLHLASYVVISEVPAEDWGYDGRTQAARRQDGPHSYRGVLATA
ncbi:MAG: tautomerase family protein [Moraxellaceae bacterium]|nr:tautomerase family protein [Moraxellaceae bacterium]